MSIHFREQKFFEESGKGSGAPPDWRAELPDDLKADPSLQSFKSVADLAKSYRETKSLVGSSIRPPGPDASAEARKEFIEKIQKAAPDLVYAPENGGDEVEAQFWKRLGRPEKAEDYAADPAVEKIVNMAELRALAQTTGMTKKQFSELAKTIASAKEKADAEVAKTRDELKQEWGAAYGERIAAAAAAAAKLGAPEGQVKAILAGEFPVEQVRFMFKVAEAVGANPRELAGQAPVPQNTPAMAQAAIDEINANMKHPYWDEAHPEHKSAVKRMLDLRRQVAGRKAS